FQLFNTPGTEIAPGSNEVGKNVQSCHSKSFCVWLLPFFSSLLCGLLFLETRSNQRIVKAVIPLMTRMLEQRADRLLHWNLGSPRTRPRRLIFNGESILNRVRIDSRKSFDHSHVFARSSQRILSVEVRRLDHESVSVPMTARIAKPLANISRDMRSAVERD